MSETKRDKNALGFVNGLGDKLQVKRLNETCPTPKDRRDSPWKPDTTRGTNVKARVMKLTQLSFVFTNILAPLLTLAFILLLFEHTVVKLNYCKVNSAVNYH